MLAIVSIFYSAIKHGYIRCIFQKRNGCCTSNQTCGQA